MVAAAAGSFALLLFAGRARAQATPDAGTAALSAGVGQDTDPTKPVLFSFREEYYELPNGNWINNFILRKDDLVWKETTFPGQARGVLLRMELPETTAHFGGESEGGLGDGYVQALLLPRLSGPFMLAAGTGLVLPTATERVLGSGKWTIAPILAPLWFIPRQRYAFVKFQEFESFAGPSSRPDVSFLLVTPTFLTRVLQRYWVLVDSESRTDWTRGSVTSYKSGLLVGTMFTPRVGLSVKAEVPWGNHRLGEWTLKATLFWTRF
jgi:hypothetical protein